MMYAEYWGLTDSPFSNRPEARWYYSSGGHEEALSRLLFLVENRRRCGLLAGPAGGGKSLLLEMLRRSLDHSPRELIQLDLFGHGVADLLWDLSTAVSLPLPRSSSVRDLWRAIEEHLEANTLAQTPTVLVCDHLDDADPECVLALRRLHGVAASSACGLTLIPVVRRASLLLRQSGISQLADLKIELPPLEEAETRAYIDALLEATGCQTHPFEPAACLQIHRLSKGLPRTINQLCDLALLAGMASEVDRVTAEMVVAVAEELPTAFRPHRPAALVE